MNQYMLGVTQAAQAWTDSFDSTAVGHSMVELAVQDAFDTEPPTTLSLAELVCDDLRHLLVCDAAARSGSGAVPLRRSDLTEGDQVRYAATRLEMLTNRRGYVQVDLGWPKHAADALAEARTAAGALSAIVASVSDTVLDRLGAGALVALGSMDAPRAVPDQQAVHTEYSRKARRAVELLNEAHSVLAALAGDVAGLTPAALTQVPSREDGPTLHAEAVLEIEMPYGRGTSRVHVRVFRPANAKPVVLIGSMTDNHGPSVTNAVEEIAATVAEVMLNGTAHDSVHWIQFYGPGNYDPHGLYEQVFFATPFTDPGWGGIKHAGVEKLAGGQVRPWHAQDHTLVGLTAHGVQVIRPVFRRRRRP